MISGQSRRCGNSFERRLDAQHRDVVRRTRHGAFPAGDRTGPEPEPADLAAELAAAVTEGALGLSFDGRASGDLTGRLRELRADGSPAKGARLSARVVGPGLSPANVWLGKAGTDGAAKVAAALPAAAALAVVFRAELDESSGRLRIERGTGGSAAGAEAVASADAEEPSPTVDPDEQEMTKLQPASVSD